MIVLTPGAAEGAWLPRHPHPEGRCLPDSQLMEGRGSVVFIQFFQPQALCQAFGESHSPDF